jgi:uncharacterized protein (DUF433 family)
MKSAETANGDPATTGIVDRGDGPKINGTRITVYTILEYLIGAWSKERIAELLNLNEAQVQAAIDYIEEHDLEVLRTYVKILERIRRGNPPEIQAKIDEGRGKARELSLRLQEARAAGASAEALRAMIDAHRKANVARDANGKNHEVDCPLGPALRSKDEVR